MHHTVLKYQRKINKEIFFSFNAINLVYFKTSLVVSIIYAHHLRVIQKLVAEEFWILTYCNPVKCPCTCAHQEVKVFKCSKMLLYVIF